MLQGSRMSLLLKCSLLYALNLRHVALPVKEIYLNQNKGLFISHIWMFVIANNVHKASPKFIVESVQAAAKIRGLNFSVSDSEGRLKSYLININQPFPQKLKLFIYFQWSNVTHVTSFLVNKQNINSLINLNQKQRKYKFTEMV